MPQVNVYLAGPDVFYPDAKQRGEDKRIALANYNLVGHYPLDNELESQPDRFAFGLAIGKANEQMMSKCQVILANMDPWHGPGADNGTTFEMGFMSALANNNPDILIVGYYSHSMPHNFATRVAKMVYADKVFRDANRKLVGSNGLTIEDFDMQDNLMLIHAVHKTGGKIFGSFEEAAQNIHALLAIKKETKASAYFMPMFNRESKQAYMFALSGVVVGALSTAVVLSSNTMKPR